MEQLALLLQLFGGASLAIGFIARNEPMSQEQVASQRSYFQDLSISKLLIHHTRRAIRLFRQKFSMPITLHDFRSMFLTIFFVAVMWITLVHFCRKLLEGERYEQRIQDETFWSLSYTIIVHGISVGLGGMISIGITFFLLNKLRRSHIRLANSKIFKQRMEKQENLKAIIFTILVLLSVFVYVIIDSTFAILIIYVAIEFNFSILELYYNLGGFVDSLGSFWRVVVNTLDKIQGADRSYPDHDYLHVLGGLFFPLSVAPTFAVVLSYLSITIAKISPLPLQRAFGQVIQKLSSGQGIAFKFIGTVLLFLSAIAATFSKVLSA